MSLRASSRQISRFFGVGLVSTLGDYGTLVVLREAFGVDPVLGALAGYGLGGLVNYLLNREHTFATRRSHAQAGWRFLVVMAVGFALTGLLMALFVRSLGAPYFYARLATTALVFTVNFAAHKFWTFAAPKPV